MSRPKPPEFGKTARMFPETESTIVSGPPVAEEATLVGTMPAGFQAEPATAEPAVTVEASRPPVEVEVRHVKNPAKLTKRAMVTYEIWTKNRVYNLDASLMCIEVIDLASGSTDTRHTMLGAVLVGGQMRESGGRELVYPLPTPGSDAVFQKEDDKGRVRLVVTSTVTRTILHVQKVQVVADLADETWNQIALSQRGTLIRGDKPHQ